MTLNRRGQYPGNSRSSMLRDSSPRPHADGVGRNEGRPDWSLGGRRAHQGTQSQDIRAYGWSLKTIQKTLDRPLSKMDNDGHPLVHRYLQKRESYDQNHPQPPECSLQLLRLLDSKESEKTNPSERSVPAPCRSIKPPASSILTRSSPWKMPPAWWMPV